MDYIDDIAGRLTAAAIAFAVAGLAVAALSAAALGGVRASEKWPSAPVPRFGRPAVMAGALLGLVMFALAAGLFSLAQFGTGLNANVRVLLAVGVDLAALALGLWLVSYVAGNIEMRTLINVPDQPMNPPPIPVSGDPTRYQMPDYTETPMEPEPQDYPHAAPEPRHPQQYQQAYSEPRSPYAPDTAATGSLPAARSKVPTIPTDTRPGWVFQDRGTGAYYAAVAQSRGGISLLALDDFTVARTASLVGPLELVGSVEATVWPLENGENGRTEAEADR
ncbi:hypothetical protein [Glycomyces algeriensis]|uniref:Uncharacterized protein n=1 Tax=Glycomyces algeriensis TaxID=256037 RepID=A0A9W6G4D0_9ACTN|nr:hypothetical protein [Glycomyces algeriensis]MDA1367524.1 hypothetical protein [Glycomyces algeriensis]MDR7353113.1 hypothetical protein [Glycomyces algeriensis]GLI40805.1 hypothetical protein GALLR39Z86_06550 [Glycomyces algeriensis]